MSDNVPVIQDKPPPATETPATARGFTKGQLLYCKDPERERWIMVTYEQFDRIAGGKRVHRVSKTGNRGTLLVNEDDLKDQRPED